MVEILALANLVIERNSFKISNLRLQKLLYYVYGIMVAVDDDLIINEYPEAWEYGPVFPTVYHTYKHFGIDKITSTDGTPAYYSDLSISAVNAVVEGFGPLKDFEIVARTHQPRGPWRQTYRPGIKNNTISIEKIKKYFRENILIDNEDTN